MPRTRWYRNNEVVAGLIDDRSAAVVARAAAAEAERHRAVVRFVRVHSGGMGADAPDGSPEVVFQIALDALRGHSRVGCIFEVATGDPATTLVHRSRASRALVVGESSNAVGAALVEYCRAHAACPVITVPTGDHRSSEARSPSP